MESNSKLYLLVLYIGFLAPFLLRGLTWAMLYVWTKNYPQVVGTCSGHHGQLISQNCVLTKIRAEPPPLNCNLKVAEIHEIVEFWPFRRFSSNLGVASTYAKLININTKLFYYTIKPITNTNELHSLRHEAYF